MDLDSPLSRSVGLFRTYSAFGLILLFCDGTKGQSEPLNSYNFTSVQRIRKFQVPPNYEKDFRPAKFGEAVNVEMDIHVQTINPIMAVDMDFRMKLILTQRWVDPRLKFSDELFYDSDRIILTNALIDLIWHPDPFIANAKATEVGQLTQKQINVYIFKNQSVSYTVNIFATIACSMQFQFYPFDYQLCPTIIESFSYDETKVRYTWARTDAFTINGKLEMLQFQLTYPLRVEECSIRRVKEDKNVSQIIAYFRFDRLLGNHLIQTFSPCSLVVSLSWFSFWLELDAISARVSLLVTTMLTLFMQFSWLKVDLPPVAYIKAVDIWMAGCMVFVFGALGEFVVVKVICSLTEEELSKEGTLIVRSQSAESGGLVTPAALLPKENSGYFQSKLMILKSGTESPDSRSGPVTTVLQRKNLGSAKKVRPSFEYPDLRHSFGGYLGLPLVWTNSKTQKHHVLWREIDSLCRWLFPLSFCIFLFVYWMVLYLHSRLNSPSVKPPSYCG